MVTRYGMSEKLGPRVLGRNHGLPFLGRDVAAELDYSEEIAREIDEEIRRLVDGAHERARQLLLEHLDELHALSLVLIERETIDRDQLERLLAGEPPARVFPEKAEPPVPEREAGDAGRTGPRPSPVPRPLPGVAMQPPNDGSQRAESAAIAGRA
jgi:cell division protease FtsH